MIRVNHATGVVKPFRGMSKRWDCPACRRNKFVDKIQHLVSVDKMVMTIEEHPGSVRALADDLGEGCFVVYLDTGKALVVTTPIVLPDVAPIDPQVMMWDCIHHMDAHGVKRMVISDPWKAPEAEPQVQTVRYAGCDTMDEVNELLEDVGFSRRWGYYATDGISAHEVVERLDEALFQRGGIDPIL